MVKLANFCQTLAKPLYCTSARYLNRENQILNRMLIGIRHWIVGSFSKILI